MIFKIKRRFQTYASMTIFLTTLNQAFMPFTQCATPEDNKTTRHTENESLKISYFQNADYLVGISSDKEAISSIDQDNDPDYFYVDLTKKQSWRAFRRQILFDSLNTLQASLFYGWMGVAILTSTPTIFMSLKPLRSKDTYFHDKNKKVKVLTQQDIKGSIVFARTAAVIGFTVAAVKSVYRILQGTDNLGRKMGDELSKNNQQLVLNKIIVFMVKKGDEAASRTALLNKGFMPVIMQKRSAPKKPKGPEDSHP
jgi:hypothetical protein